MFRREKKANFLLFSSGYLTPRGWALQLDWGVTFQWVRNLGLTCLQKWKRPGQPRQANVLKRKKGGLPFISWGYLTPRG
ncbi:hypothetical protein ACQCVP_02645 [Rossellomorea vietnamensis]